MKEVLALSISHAVTRNSSLCLWRYQEDQEKVESVFGRQALPIVWDFAEAVPISESTGSFLDSIEIVVRAIQFAGSVFIPRGQAQLSDACASPLPDQACGVMFTDPPYYDAIPYSDLSDFFFVWLKRALPDHSLLRDPFDGNNRLTPKTQEAVQDEIKLVDGGPKDRSFFEKTIGRAFAEGRRILDGEGIGCIVFAHKTTEGWEALLSGMISGGWVITGSWPIATEMRNRLRARDSAALATSVHLVCRPRPRDAPIGDWSEVLRELPKRVIDWMERLQQEGIRGADLVFACIGPALEIFSRYSKVERAEGTEVSLSQYLEKVWEIVARCALEQVLGTSEGSARNQDAGDLEEGARLTALFLWTLQGTNGDSVGNGSRDGESEEEEMEEDDEEVVSRKKSKGFSLIYDVVRRLAQPLGINLSRWEGRIIETRKGVVRLLSVTERASQLVEHGVAQDLSLIKSPQQSRVVQFDLFGEVQKEEDVATNVRQRVEKQTWSQLHLDSIPTLDHVHKAMLFQKQGETTALRELLFYEKHYRPDFVRLANAFSALYPKGSEEKRLVDAMLLALPR